MSIDATRWAWQQSITPSSHKLVLLSLADCADEENVCYVNFDRLASDCDLTFDAIVRACNALQKKGFMTQVPAADGWYVNLRVEDES